MRFGVYDLGVYVCGVEFSVWGLGSKVQSLKFKVSSSVLRGQR